MSRTTHPDPVRFVAGAGQDAGDAAMARHLEGCNTCRREVAELVALRRSLRAAADHQASGVVGHVAVEALVAYETGVADPVADRAADGGEVAAHLAACPECRADLAALQRSRRELATGRFVPAAMRRRWRWPAAAAAAAVVLAGAVFGVRRAFEPRETPATASEALTLLPPRRGEGKEPRLIAGRRVALRIALPFGTPSGPYDTRLEAADGGASVRIPSSVVEDGEILETSFDVPRTSGSYRIVVRPLGEARAASIVYPLRVVAPAAAPAAD
jgi:anti-sigma factor ChrR (cupin superfamily)